MANITVTTEPIVSPGPTITHYQQLAADLMHAFDQIATIIPQLAEADLVTAKFTRGQLNVSEQFCATVIGAVEQFAELQAVNKLDPAAGRDTLQFLEAFRSVRDKSTTFTRSIKFTFASRKAGLVRQCLQIYAIAKSLDRDKRSPELEAAVENMARDLGRRGQKRPSEASAAKKAAKAAEKEVAAA